MATFGTFVAGQVLTAAELNSAGTWQDYTPTWTQSATITKTVNWARYMQLNKLVIGSIKMTASSAGTANNKILVGLPAAASSNNFIIGTGVFQDESQTPDIFVRGSWVAVYESSTTISFTAIGGGGASPDATLRCGQTGSSFADQVASGDIFYIQFAYEAA